MIEYRVTWEIDIWAERPIDAAREALRIHRDTESIATVFRVYSKHWPDGVEVDLGALLNA